jgi:hypothetical protein
VLTRLYFSVKNNNVLGICREKTCQHGIRHFLVID